MIYTCISLYGPAHWILVFIAHVQGSPFNAHLDVSSGALEVYLWPETVWCMQAGKALEGLVFEPGQAA